VRTAYAGPAARLDENGTVDRAVPFSFGRLEMGAMVRLCSTDFVSAQ
jgi:hypothetical protein